jgi:hypothetical protein
MIAIHYSSLCELEFGPGNLQVLERKQLVPPHGSTRARNFGAALRDSVSSRY